jgi:hypothetical protein
MHGMNLKICFTDLQFIYFQTFFLSGAITKIYRIYVEYITYSLVEFP